MSGHRNKTLTGATETAEGIILHREVFADCGLILAPVKLQLMGGHVARSRRDTAEYPIPLRRDGRLVYALPGGGEILA